MRYISQLERPAQCAVDAQYNGRLRYTEMDAELLIHQFNDSIDDYAGHVGYVCQARIGRGSREESFYVNYHYCDIYT